MEQELTKLYNTMVMIETKGENTIIMSDCLRFIKDLISREQNKPQQDIPKEVE